MVRTIERTTLVDKVLHRVGDYILENGLNPGDRLPPERQLAEEFGVSCSPIREAFKVLQAIGAVTRKPKRGTILQEVDLSMLSGILRFLLLRNNDDLVDLFVARRIIEVNVLLLVAENCSEENYREMEEANRLLEHQIDTGGLGIEGDIAFHQALLRAADNKFLSQFGGMIQEFIQESRMRALVEAGPNRRTVLDDHRQILAALREHNVEEAERILKRHIDRHILRGALNPSALPHEDRPDDER